MTSSPPTATGRRTVPIELLDEAAARLMHAANSRVPCAPLGMRGFTARSCATQRRRPSDTASTCAPSSSRSASGLVGGQEDMIIDVALGLVAEGAA
jgi:hypothetical protein